MRVGAELRQLGDAVDQPGHLRPEAILDIGEAVLGVLRDIVKERRLHRDRVDPEVRDDLCAGDWMDHIHLARSPGLAGVRLDCQVEGLVDSAEVRLWVMAEQGGQERCPERLDRVDTGCSTAFPLPGGGGSGRGRSRYRGRSGARGRGRSCARGRGRRRSLGHGRLGGRGHRKRGRAATPSFRARNRLNRHRRSRIAAAAQHPDQARSSAPSRYLRCAV